MVLDDDRVLAVSNVMVNEGSPYAVFTVTGGNNQQATLSLANQNADGANLATLQYFDGSTWQPYAANQVVSLSSSGSLLVRVALSPEQETALDGPETFNLVATNTGGTVSTGGLGTIKDDGSGDYFAANNNTATPALPSGVVLDDDRSLAVAAFGPVNEASTYAMFTVTGNAGYSLDLSLEGTAALGDKEANYSGFTLIEYATDGSTWSTYGPSSKPTVPGSGVGTGTVYVRVTITSELDAAQEGAEGFALKAAYTTNTTKNATGETSIVDDGKGKKYGPNMASGTPQESTTGLDDDTPKPPQQPVVQQSQAQTPAPATVGGGEAPVERAPQTFTSALGAPQDAARMQLSTGMPILEVGERLTSRSGFPIVVDSNRPPGLQVFKGVTDQFVEGTSVAKVSMPADAFVHSKSDAVIELLATQADGSALPPWIRFDARIGGFEVEGAPDGFKGKVDVKVVARDGEGGEATVLFRIFVGDKPATDKPGERPQGRVSLSEKLRLAAKRPVLDLVLIAEPEQPQESAVAVSEAPAPAAAPVN